MPLNVLTPEGNTHSIHSARDFEEIFRIGFLPHVEFIDPKTQFKVEKRCDKALDRGWITQRQKWLGQYYTPGIRGAIPLDLKIAWIDATIGYGVFTQRDIPAKTFIGEYTGIIRKRRFFGRWDNLYCFDYHIGEGRRSSFVIDAQDYGNHTRFINHDDQPNLEPVCVYCDGLLHVILYASKEIPAGTQLCYDYGKDYWKKRNKPIKLTSR